MDVRKTHVAGRALVASDVEATIASAIGTTLGLGYREIERLDARTRLDDDELGVDSIDRLALARTVSRAFELYESGADEYLLQRRSIGDWTQIVLDAWAGLPTRVTFRSSGSTGEPEEHRHAVATLWEEIELLASLLPERTRVVGSVPRHHIYGFLFTVLLPRALGVPFVERRGASVAEFHATLEPGDLLVGFPLRYDDLAAAGTIFTPGVVAVTSTGPARAATLERLLDLGLGRTIEIYGSSQTAGIAWRDEPRAPYRLFPYWSLAADGASIARVDPASGAPIAIVLPDRLVARGDGFDVVGRIDGAVVVGGINVYPGRIAERIRTYPGVIDCAVRPMRAGEGERLKAFVVIECADERDRPARETALRHWLNATLEVAERPKPVTFGAALPRDAQGKVIDW